MLARAEAKGVYDRLIQADVLATGLARRHTAGARVLADEHLVGLWPLYHEARGWPRRPACSSSSAIIRTFS